MAVISFSQTTLEVPITDNLGAFKVFLCCQELSNERTMTSVRQFLSFERNDGDSGFFANLRVDVDPLDDLTGTSKLAWWMF